MLTGVLLHVVEAARPVDLRGGRGARHERLLDDMHDIVVSILDVEYPNAIDRPGVEWLTARCWIERRPIEHDFDTAVARLATDDRRVERRAGGLGVIDSCGHARCSIGRAWSSK